MPKTSEELGEIKKKLAEIDKKLDQTMAYFASSHRIEYAPKTITALPEHLRKTASAIAELGEATAEQVAAKTGRTRAAESDYLNQLTDQSIVRRERKGREVYFRVFALYTLCQHCGARVLITLQNCAICGASLSAGK